MDPDPELQAKIRRFEERWADEPDSLVFARLADLHRRAGSPERSLRILERGLDRHPEHVTGHLVRGRVYRDLGRRQRAAEAFRRALDFDEENLVALRALGELARERGAREEAVRRFRRVIELDPEDEDARRELARLRSGSGDREAGQGEEEGDLATPTLAELYADQGFYEEAVEMYRDLLRQRPDDSTLLARLREVRSAMDGSGAPATGAETATGEPGVGEAEAPEPEPEVGREGGAPARPARSGDRPGPGESGRGSEGRGPPPDSGVGGWRQAVGAAQPPPPTIRQHLRELLRGEAVPGLVNRSLPEALKPATGEEP